MLIVVAALLPVSAFLAALFLCDSFKLVPVSTLVRALAAGALTALVAWALYRPLIALTGLSPAAFSKAVAPVSEELLKALCVLWALRRREIGFLVDAAIVGFAIGAGFALVENLEYLATLGDTHVWLWIARGFGTAMLHAATTAVVAVGAKALGDRYPTRGLLPAIALPLIGAIALHALYNQALVTPVLAAAIPMIVLPLVVVFVFDRSEKITREWVGDGLDLDVELLRLTRSGAFTDTRLGRYLIELQARFPGPVVADMFCLLQLDLELAIRAKGMLLAREAGLEVPLDDDLQNRLTEREYLRKSIGTTGLLALRPLNVTSDQDAWNEYLLRHARHAKPER